MKKITLILLLFLPAALFGAAGDWGTNSIFIIGSGARAAAMGNAFTAQQGDLSCMLYNPAGLAAMEKQEASLMYYPLYEGAVFNSAAYANPILDVGTIGAAFYMFSSGDMAGYGADDISTGNFTSSEYKFTAAYAAKINAALSAGVSANIYGTNIADVKSVGFGSDAGVVYSPFEWLDAGLSIQNLIKPSMNMQEVTESLPQRYVIGAAGKYATGDFKFRGGLDLMLGESEGFKYALGLEAGWMNIVFLRSGLDDSRLSFGAGAGYFGARLDYSYTLDDFGSGLSKFTLSYAFGQSLKEQDAGRKNSLMQEVKKQVEKDLTAKMAQKAAVFVETAKALYAQKNYEAAYQQVLKALEWQKLQPIVNLKNEIAQAAAQQYYNQAAEEYNAGNYLEAMDRFSETVKYVPAYKDTKKYIPEIKQKLGISGEADRVFASGVEFYINKHYNEAIKEWEKALINDPENATIKLYISKAKTAMQAKHDGKALTAEQEKQIDELYMSAVEAYTSGDLKKAVSMLEQVLKIDPENVKALRDMEKAKAEMLELEKRGIK